MRTIFETIELGEVGFNRVAMHSRRERNCVLSIQCNTRLLAKSSGRVEYTAKLRALVETLVLCQYCLCMSGSGAALRTMA